MHYGCTFKLDYLQIIEFVSRFKRISSFRYDEPTDETRLICPIINLCTTFVRFFLFPMFKYSWSELLL